MQPITGMPANKIQGRWRKSGRSTDHGAQCVEVAFLPGTVAVRDSQDPDGPALVVSSLEFAAFAAGIKTGSLA